jgi:hypothetical protein
MKSRRLRLIAGMKDDGASEDGRGTLKKGRASEEVFNVPVENHSMGMVFLNIDITVDEERGEQYVVRARKRAVFDAANWETELLWQAVRVIVEHDGGQEEARTALQVVLGKLQEQSPS